MPVVTCIEDLRRAARRDVGALGDVRADRKERGVEPALLHGLLNVGDFAVQVQVDAELQNSFDFKIKNVPGKAVLGNAEAHHAARDRAGLVDLDRVPEPGEVIGRGQAGRPRANDENSFAG